MDKLFLVAMLAVVFITIVGIGAYNNKNQLQFIMQKIKGSYGNKPIREYADGEYRHIAGYFNNHKGDYHVDDITWNDLSMDDIFMDMNHCQSSAGEEYLYYMLRTPDMETRDKSRMEKQISFYAANDDKRLDMQMALFKCGRTGKYSIYDYLNNLDVIADKNANQDIWLLLLYAAAIVVCFVSLKMGILSLAVLLMYGGVAYFKTKRDIEPYITSFAYVFRILAGARTLCAVSDDCIDEEKEKLRELTKSLKKFERFSYLIMSKNSGTGNLAELILDYVRIFFHVDIIKFFNMRDEISRHWDDIDEMLTVMGQLDATVAITCYRAYLGDYSIPEWSEDTLTAKGLYHPLLSNPVANDVELEKGILLTGSNASGKSTMLKAVTVAAIMAQSINTVPALAYKAPHYRVYTSLALNDDILAGESYYMTEIKSLKRIIDAGKDTSVPILACVDEVLRGTNTIERISASSVILRNLSAVNGRILAATHDLELADILADVYDNYHFEETVEGDDILFAYKMFPGKATTRNAIKLLEIVGYDKEITDEAQALAKKYEETGSF